MDKLNKFDEKTRAKLAEIINKNERLQDFGVDEDYIDLFVETSGPSPLLSRAQVKESPMA